MELNFSTGFGTLGLFPETLIIPPGGLFITMFCGLAVVMVLIAGAVGTELFAAPFLVAFLRR